MEVKAISNSQPSFNGYLGRNIQTYVNDTVKKEVNYIVGQANLRVERVDAGKITEIKKLGDGVLRKLSEFVGKMNEKTSLDLNDVDSSFIRFIFKNPIANGKDVRVFNSSVFTKPTMYADYVGMPECQDLEKIYNASKKDLQKLDNMADGLLKLDSKEIDNVFYTSASKKLKNAGESATGFWSKLKVRKLAKCLDEFAKGLGIDGSARVRAEEYLKIAREQKISNKNFEKEMKECSKNNKKIVDEILKG